MKNEGPEKIEDRPGCLGILGVIIKIFGVSLLEVINKKKTDNQEIQLSTGINKQDEQEQLHCEDIHAEFKDGFKLKLQDFKKDLENIGNFGYPITDSYILAETIQKCDNFINGEDRRRRKRILNFIGKIKKIEKKDIDTSKLCEKLIKFSENIYKLREDVISKYNKRFDGKELNDGLTKGGIDTKNFYKIRLKYLIKLNSVLIDNGKCERESFNKSIYNRLSYYNGENKNNRLSYYNDENKKYDKSTRYIEKLKEIQKNLRKIRNLYMPIIEKYYDENGKDGIDFWSQEIDMGEGWVEHTKHILDYLIKVLEECKINDNSERGTSIKICKSFQKSSQLDLEEEIHKIEKIKGLLDLMKYNEKRSEHLLAFLGDSLNNIEIMAKNHKIKYYPTTYVQFSNKDFPYSGQYHIDSEQNDNADTKARKGCLTAIFTFYSQFTNHLKESILDAFSTKGHEEQKNKTNDINNDFFIQFNEIFCELKKDLMDKMRGINEASLEKITSHKLESPDKIKDSIGFIVNHSKETVNNGNGDFNIEDFLDILTKIYSNIVNSRNNIKKNLNDDRANHESRGINQQALDESIIGDKNFSIMMLDFAIFLLKKEKECGSNSKNLDEDLTYFESAKKAVELYVPIIEEELRKQSEGNLKLSTIFERIKDTLEKYINDVKNAYKFISNLPDGEINIETLYHELMDRIKQIDSSIQPDEQQDEQKKLKDEYSKHLKKIGTLVYYFKTTKDIDNEIDRLNSISKQINDEAGNGNNKGIVSILGKSSNKKIKDCNISTKDINDVFRNITDKISSLNL